MLVLQKGTTGRAEPQVSNRDAFRALGNDIHRYVKEGIHTSVHTRWKESQGICITTISV